MVTNSAPSVIDLTQLTVRTPCPMDWELMDGDEQRRFCSRCQKHVYNFSSMTRNEIGRLIGQADAGVCGRMYRRPDGTVVTAECPPLERSPRGRGKQFSLAALMTLLTSSAAVFASVPWVARAIEPWLERWREPPAPTFPADGFLVGDIMLEPECTLEETL